MKFDKKKIAIIVSCLALLVLLPAGCDAYFKWHYKRMATPLIDLVEQYHKATGKYPKTEREIGYDNTQQNVGPFYRLVDSTQYNVFYSDDHGNLFLYNSKKGDWEHVGM